MGLPIAKHHLTPKEYYQLERVAETRHDYYEGEIFDMFVGTIVHSRISSNIISELALRLKGSSCAAFEANLRLFVQATGLRCYPNASVYCGPLETDPRDSEDETVANPTIVFEVLSPSTEKYDRGAKSDNYRTIPSLKAYVLVSQSSPRVEAFYRQEDGGWSPVVEINGLDGTLRLPPIKIEIPLRDIYDRVDFTKSASVVL